MTLKIIQINLDRGKEATTLLIKKMKDEDIDIALIQEPYHRQIQEENYITHGRKKGAKTLIVTKTSIQSIITRQDLTDNNYTTIAIEGVKDDTLLITSIYDEPGGNENKRLEEFTNKLKNTNSKHLLAGDINAHNSVWGGTHVDQRGGKLLDWTMKNMYEIHNDGRQPPTFTSSQGSSYIDMTLTKGITLKDWTVSDEESLSLHKYITYNIETEVKKNEEGKEGERL